MSIFTVVIIIWVLYQLATSFMRKGNDGRPIRQAMQGTPQDSWREQMKKALENSSRKAEEWTIPLEALESRKSKDIMGAYIHPQEQLQGNTAQGQEGVEVNQSIEEASFDKGAEERGGYRIEGEVVSVGAQPMSRACFSRSKKELAQGIVWSEILGKPRAFRPFRGPRS